MAVQINEVIIRAVVNSTTDLGNNGGFENLPQGSNSGFDLVEKVFEILKEKKER